MPGLAVTSPCCRLRNRLLFSTGWVSNSLWSGRLQSELLGFAVQHVQQGAEHPLLQPGRQLRPTVGEDIGRDPEDVFGNEPVAATHADHGPRGAAAGVDHDVAGRVAAADDQHPLAADLVQVAILAAVQDFSAERARAPAACSAPIARPSNRRRRGSGRPGRPAGSPARCRRRAWSRCRSGCRTRWCRAGRRRRRSPAGRTAPAGATGSRGSRRSSGSRRTRTSSCWR